ncbi:MAG: IS6 family transposase [Pseudomonadales bacterium]|nr:IS6 family transposase [Pseudomonadales bacterium]
MIPFKGRHTPGEIILQCVRWYCAHPLSYRNIEEMMAERGIVIDHSTLNRWVIHYSSQLEKAFHNKKKRPGDRWRMDETYLKIKGNGDTSTVVSISKVTQFIFYLQLSEIRNRLYVSSQKPSVEMVNLA